MARRRTARWFRGSGLGGLRTSTTVACLLLALTACGSGEATGAGYRAGQTHQPYDVPSTALTDTSGASYSLTKDTDKPLTLVFFGYTHCPDICQVVMSTIASAMTRLDDADRKRVDVVFVTTDPSRDTGTVLRKYLDHFDPGFIGLTGDLRTISAIARPLAVYVAKGQKLPSGGRDLNTHSSQVTGITADDRSPILWTQDTSSGDLAADIHTLLQRN